MIHHAYKKICELFNFFSRFEMTQFAVFFIGLIVITFWESDAFVNRIVSCNYSVNETVAVLLCSCTWLNDNETKLDQWLNLVRDGTTCQGATLFNCFKNVTLRIKSCPWPVTLSYYCEQLLVSPASIFRLDVVDLPTATENQDQDIRVTNHSFRELSQLRFLNLKLRLVKSISENALESTLFLREIDLSENGISLLDERLFHANIELRKIDLSHNRISFISNVTFSSTRKLFSLDLSYNSLTQINA